MIAFGSSMIWPETYERLAKPGILRTVEPDSPVFAHQAAGDLYRSYNLILEEAAACEDLEALVLIHQDAEIVDPDFCQKVRESVRDPDVGVVGCVGVVGARSIAWWEGSLTWSSLVYRYGDAGGGDMPGASFGEGVPRSAQGTGEVDSLDGVLMVLSPWAVRTLRFDEGLGPVRGYDFDFCQQVRAAGRKVVTADFGIVHHHSLDLVADNEPWVAAHIRVAEKWDGRVPASVAASELELPATEADWQRRARRAEAEAAAARLKVESLQLQADAVTRSHGELLHSFTATRSWKVTRPLRWANGRARTYRDARAARTSA